jgi:DNA primase
MNYTHDVVIAYDADAAGIKAAQRASEIIRELGCQVRIVSITGAKDPDEYIKQYGIAGWTSIIEKATTLVQFKLLQAVKQYGVKNVAAKQRILQEVLPNLAAVASPLELEEAVQQTATILQVNWETVLAELKKFQAGNRKKSQIRDNSVKDSHNISSNAHRLSNNPRDARTQAETGLLRLALENRQWLQLIVNELGQKFFQNQDYQSIFEIYLDSDEESLAKLFNLLPETKQPVLSQLMMLEIPEVNLDQILKDYIHTIKRLSNKAKLDQLLAQLAQAERVGDTEMVKKLSREINLTMMKSEGPERGVAT